MKKYIIAAALASLTFTVNAEEVVEESTKVESTLLGGQEAELLAAASDQLDSLEEAVKKAEEAVEEAMAAHNAAEEVAQIKDVSTDDA